MERTYFSHGKEVINNMRKTLKRIYQPPCTDVTPYRVGCMVIDGSVGTEDNFAKEGYFDFESEDDYGYQENDGKPFGWSYSAWDAE